MSSYEERVRTLKLIESGQISAEEGAQLLETLEADAQRQRNLNRTRSLRVQVTDLATRRPKVNVTIPISLIGVGLKLGARLFPKETNSITTDLRHAVDTGVIGRVFDLQDLEENERIEIFLEP